MPLILHRAPRLIAELFRYLLAAIMGDYLDDFRTRHSRLPRCATDAALAISLLLGFILNEAAALAGTLARDGRRWRAFGLKDTAMMADYFNGIFRDAIFADDALSRLYYARLSARLPHATARRSLSSPYAAADA